MRTLGVVILLLVPFLAVRSQDELLGGGTARNISLGGGPVNPYLLDLLRVHINPAMMPRYPDRIWGDVGFLAVDVPQGGSRGQYIGASLEVRENLWLGLLLNRRESPLYNVDPVNAPRDPIREINTMVASVLGLGAQQFSRPLSPFELVGSVRTDWGDVGAAIAYGRWTGERSNDPRVEQSTTTVRFKIGLLTAPRSDFSLDAAALLGLNSITGTSTPTSGSKNELNMSGGTEFGVDLRGIYSMNEQWTLLPIARWYSFSWGVTQTRNGLLLLPDPTSEYLHWEIELGAGAQLLKESFLFTGGLSYQRVSLTTDMRTSETSVVTVDLPKINFGVEVSLASWLVGRIGYFNRLAVTKTTVGSGSGKVTITSSTELPWYGDLNGLNAAQQRISLGVGLKFEGMTLDGTLGEGYFLNGPWPLSGAVQSLFGVLSVGYRFE